MDSNYKEEIGKLLKTTDDINFEIRSLKKDNETLTADNNEKIQKLQKKMENVEFDLKDTFTKTGEEKIQTKMGYTTWNIVKKKFVYTNSAIEEIERTYPKTANKYIKVSKTLIKDPLKKDLAEGIVILSTRSLVISPEDKKFVYKYTGGNN